MKILCINVRKGIGDQIIFLPYLHAISKKFKVPVSLLAKENSKARELFYEDKLIDEVIDLKKNMDGVMGILRLSKEIKSKGFDKIFIFNSSLRYNIVSRLAGIKSIYQYPLFRRKDNIVLSAKIFTEDVLNEVVSTEPNLTVKNNEYLDKEFKHIGLGISASGPTKRWDVNNYIKLAEKINKKTKCKFYIAGGKNDVNLINEFKNSEIKNNFMSFENLSIRQTLPLIKNMNLMISNDTSWSHIAVSLKIKTLTLFMDSPVMAYGRYSSRMNTIEPEGEKDTTTHDTLGKDRISFDEVYKKSIEMLN